MVRGAARGRSDARPAGRRLGRADDQDPGAVVMVSTAGRRYGRIAERPATLQEITMTLSRPPSATPRAPTFEGRPLHDPSEPVYDQGLAFDVETLLDRRQILKLIGYGSLGAGLIALVGCAPAGSSAAASGATARRAARPRPGARVRSARPRARSSPRRPRVHFRATGRTGPTSWPRVAWSGPTSDRASGPRPPSRRASR